MRPGVRLGVDPGDARVGVARCDPSGLLASPAEVLPRDTAGQDDLVRLTALAAQLDALEIVVGLPLGLSGREGPAAAKARAYAVELAARTPIPVRLVDERLSTVVAQQAYRSQGRSTRQTRGRVDAAAAAVILQNALDTERATGTPPGEVVSITATPPSPEGRPSEDP